MKFIQNLEELFQNWNNSSKTNGERVHTKNLKGSFKKSEDFSLNIGMLMQNFKSSLRNCSFFEEFIWKLEGSVENLEEFILKN